MTKVVVNGRTTFRFRIPGGTRVRPPSSIGTVRRPLDEPESSNVSRKRRLSRLDTPQLESIAKLLLARDRFTFDELENGGLSVWLHKYALSNGILYIVCTGMQESHQLNSRILLDETCIFPYI